VYFVQLGGLHGLHIHTVTRKLSVTFGRFRANFNYNDRSGLKRIFVGGQTRDGIGFIIEIVVV
jgi:hypothetical protein